MSEATDLFVLRDEYTKAVERRMESLNTPDPGGAVQAAMRAEKAALLVLLQAELNMAASCIEIIKKHFAALTSGQVDAS